MPMFMFAPYTYTPIYLYLRLCYNITMLTNGSDLIHRPVLSMHVGGPIARTVREVISPHNLQIVAFELEGATIGVEAGNLLDVRSIREYHPDGMIIDSADELVSSGDVIKLDEVIKLNFSLVGLKVESKKGTKLGKVVDYIVNTDDMRILQLVVKRPAIKALLDPELLIHRSQIVEVTDYKIIVKDEAEKSAKTTPAETFIPNFVNPFREAPLSPAHSQTPGASDTE